ncbi:MAG: Hpt domain-containing protein [Litoreibacter sp.]
MINWTRVAELRTDLGDEGFDEVVELFLFEMEDKLDEMRIAGGIPTAADLHFLRGSSANLGFDELMGLCLAAERGEQQLTIEQILSCYSASKHDFKAKTLPSAT